ncbi:zinc ribbon domain-containing protein [Zongyangia sp. HA2173]|uniref:zinc ribbon domain-containing protein n=1 Tax=Zongyangia sp. HA2173 TaxID=3133035 RepID=UPI003162A81F
MYCPNCGSNAAETDVFCANCGTPLDQASNSSPESTVTSSTYVNAPGNPPRGNKTKLIVGSVIVAIVIIVATIMILLSQPTTIHLEDMVTIEFSGYNTVGQATAYLNSEEFDLRLAKALGKGKFDLTSTNAYAICRNAIQLSVEPANGLSNGDKAVVRISYDNEAVKEYDIKFSGKSASFTVEGLANLTEIDPFEGLNVSFSGFSPDGQVEFEYSGDNPYVGSIGFVCDKSSGLKNGDVITISFQKDSESAAVQDGYKLVQDSKKYTVDGLDEYVDSYSDLPQDFLEMAKQEAEDLIQSYVAQYYSKQSSLGPISYAGYVFNTAKPGKDADCYNEFYIIYRGMVSHVEQEFHETMVYYPVRFENLLSSSGTLDFTMDDSIAGSSPLSYGSLVNSNYTDGYANPLVAYTELITSRQDNYNCTAGDGFEKYASYSPIAGLTDIADSDLQNLDNLAMDSIAAYIADSYSDTSHASELSLVGQYLLIAKSQGNDFRNNNRLIIVFSATVSSSNNRFEPTTVYFPVQFEGLVNLPGDEFIYTEGGDILGATQFPHSSSVTKGYIDGAEMFRDLVTANRTDYTYEITEGLKAFGE